jgi:hypothetical protein
MTREEVIAVIKQATAELGRVPSFDNLVKTGKLTKHDIRKNFGGYKGALAVCGVGFNRQGYRLEMKDLFVDWASVVRQLGKIPSVMEYEMHSKYSLKPLTKHFGGWLRVPAGLVDFAKAERLEEEWKDVLELVAANALRLPTRPWASMWRSSTPSRSRILKDEPIYGPPMGDPYLLLAPTNELGVIFLFGAVCRKLGYAMLRIQPGYPDGEAMREVAPEQWQRVKIEFEFESRNFLQHRHDPKKCHVIVCWKHNWADCPLEVIELRSVVKGLNKEEIG